MLKKRIIPTLLYKDFGLVKGKQFNSWRRVGSVLPTVKVFNLREVDELIFLDITATNNKKEPNYDLIKEISKFCLVPLTIGGGINSLDQVDKMFEIGADKVSVNTASYKNPKLIYEIANKYGIQCVVASVDVLYENKKWSCYANSGLKNMKLDPVSWVKTLESYGAGEILLTSIDRDGTMNGYDHEIISAVSSSIKIPIIASGGAGNFDDMSYAISNSGASALSASSIFHFTEKTPMEVKKYLSNQGIAIRKNFFYK